MRATALAGAGIDLEPALELSSADALKHAVLSGGFATLSGRAVTAEVGPERWSPRRPPGSG